MVAQTQAARAVFHKGLVSYLRGDDAREATDLMMKAISSLVGQSGYIHSSHQRKTLLLLGYIADDIFASDDRMKLYAKRTLGNIDKSMKRIAFIEDPSTEVAAINVALSIAAALDKPRDNIIAAYSSSDAVDLINSICNKWNDDLDIDATSERLVSLSMIINSELRDSEDVDVKKLPVFINATIEFAKNDFCDDLHGVLSMAIAAIYDVISYPSQSALNALSLFSFYGNNAAFIASKVRQNARGAEAHLLSAMEDKLSKAADAFSSFDTELAQQIYSEAISVSTHVVGHISDVDGTSVSVGNISGLISNVRDVFERGDVGDVNAEIDSAIQPSMSPSREVAEFNLDFQFGVKPTKVDLNTSEFDTPQELFLLAPQIEDQDVSATIATPVLSVETDSSNADEMLEFFIEEMHEVLESMVGATNNLLSKDANSDARELIADVRRYAHTIKGSARMVGLTSIGEVGWQMEKSLNAIIEDDLDVSDIGLNKILKFTDIVKGWVCQLSAAIPTTGQVFNESMADDKSVQDAIDCSVDISASDDVDVAEEIQSEVVVFSDKTTMSPMLFNIAKREMPMYSTAIHQMINAFHVGVNSPVNFELMRSAHTLAGASRTAGVMMIGEVSLALEAWLKPRVEIGFLLSEDTFELVKNAAQVLVEQVNDFTMKKKPKAAPEIAVQLLSSCVLQEKPIEAANGAPVAPTDDKPLDVPVPISAKSSKPDADVIISDDIDVELLPLFLEESASMTDDLSATFGALIQNPRDNESINLLARMLHTLKGSARMVGAMTIGETFHHMEGALRKVMDDKMLPLGLASDQIYLIEAMYDSILGEVSSLSEREVAEEIKAESIERTSTRMHAVANSSIKVGMKNLDTLSNEAGEIGAANQRAGSRTESLKGLIVEMDRGMNNLRSYFRDIEIYAETQMQSRVTSDDVIFDPLEFDRFTRLQEITRFMTESLHDIDSVRQSLFSGMSDVRQIIAGQSKIAREHQLLLMGLRMVPVSTLAERLYKIARQSAKDTSKRINFEIIGSEVLVDTSIMDKIVAPIEHLLRNAIVHGIEEDRVGANKPVIGEITLTVSTAGDNVLFTLSDDGSGIDLGKIFAKAISLGLIDEKEAGALSLEERCNLIFLPGVTTAEELTELAGRGVGMDVVKTSIESMGGTIDVLTRSRAGTRFICNIPTALSLIDVMNVVSGNEVFSIPASSIDRALMVEPKDMVAVMGNGFIHDSGVDYPLHAISNILNSDQVARDEARPTYFLLMNNPARIALQVEEIVEQKEVQVRSLGDMVPGVSGASISGDGSIVLIVNPAAMIGTSAGKNSFATTRIVSTQKMKPVIMVVDDSLTVRKITSRFLEANGYDVITATDGQDALIKLADVVPDVMLLDIEMPRMNGFELAESVRSSETLNKLPIVMITSRTADKHRNHGLSLGVNHYLGKPYKEDELLAAIGSFTN